MIKPPAQCHVMPMLSKSKACLECEAHRKEKRVVAALFVVKIQKERGWKGKGTGRRFYTVPLRKIPLPRFEINDGKIN
jgi:hypothetical protein